MYSISRNLCSMCPHKMLFSFSKYETKNNTCNSFLPNIPCHNNTTIMYTVTFSIIIVKFPSHGIVLTVYNKPYKNNLVVRTTYSQQFKHLWQWEGRAYSRWYFWRNTWEWEVVSSFKLPLKPKHYIRSLKFGDSFPRVHPSFVMEMWTGKILPKKHVFTALFTNPPASWFLAVPWFCLVQFLKLPQAMNGASGWNSPQGSFLPEECLAAALWIAL